jgi:hypothetical protein
MGKSERRKGATWEAVLAKYLRPFFPHVRRTRVSLQTSDVGDLGGIPGWTLQAKNEKALNLAGAVDEAEWQSVNAETPFFAAIIKRRNKPVQQAYFVVPLHIGVELMRLTKHSDRVRIKK